MTSKCKKVLFQITKWIFLILALGSLPILIKWLFLVDYSVLNSTDLIFLLVVVLMTLIYDSLEYPNTEVNLLSGLLFSIAILYIILFILFYSHEITGKQTTTNMITFRGIFTNWIIVSVILLFGLVSEIIFITKKFPDHIIPNLHLEDPTQINNSPIDR